MPCLRTPDSRRLPVPASRKTRGDSVERRSINASRISSDRSKGGWFLITMAQKGSEKGSDSEESSKISPGDEMPKKNNRKSLEETLPEPFGQMLSKEEQSNTPPPSEIRNNSDVEGDGKAEKATVEKLLENPNHTNSNESLVRTVEMTVVLRCNCEGCIKEICKIIKKFEGYHNMSIDKQKNKVTVKGTMDLLKALANSLSNSKKLKNRTVLIAPLDDGGGLQADAESPSPSLHREGDGATKAAGKELDGNKSNKPPVTTVELKMAVPCSGCGGHLRQIRKSVKKTKGCYPYKVSSDEMGKVVLSVTGTMDVINALKVKLEKNFETSVEIVRYMSLRSVLVT